MGSVRKRIGSGCLFIDFRYLGHRCREQTALTDSVANRKRLAKLLERIESDIASGTFEFRRYFPTSRNAAKFDGPCVASRTTDSASSGQPTAKPEIGTTPLFKDFAETWFAEKQIEWRRSHRIGIRADLDRLLIPQFGEREVGRVTKADVLAYRAQLAKVPARGKTSPLSNNRINRILNPLRQILNEAADRHEFRSPFQNIRQLKVRKSDVDPFTLDEVRRIIETVRKDFRNYYTTRFFTGMRTGEVDGLKWKYVDFEKRLILVRETIVLGEEEYTKTDSSQREIQMTQIVFEALKRQEGSTHKGSLYVFCNRDGKPLDHKNVTQRVWYPLLRHLGLKPRRPYQCRHTAATLWLASGENPEWIARQLGHSTTEMLFRTYSRFVPNLTRRDGSAFERLLTGVLGGGERQLQTPAIEQQSENSHG